MSRREAGPNAGEVATEDLRARLDRDVRLRFLDRDESALGPRAPERRLVVVQDVRADAYGLPRAAPLQPREPVLALEMGERFGPGHGTIRSESSGRGLETLRKGRLPRKVRLAQRRS